MIPSSNRFTPASGDTPRDRFRLTVLPVLRVARDKIRLGESPSLTELLEGLGPNGASILILILSLPFLIPVSLGPITSAVSAVILALALTLIFPAWQHRLNSWLGLRLNASVVGGLRKVAAAIARRRHWEGRLPHFSALGVNGRRIFTTVMIIIHAVLLALPIPLLPFTNTLPALSIALFSMAVLRRNDLFTLLALLATGATLLWFAVIAYLGVAGAMAILKGIFGWEVVGKAAVASMKTTTSTVHQVIETTISLVNP